MSFFLFSLSNDDSSFKCEQLFHRNISTEKEINKYSPFKLKLYSGEKCTQREQMRDHMIELKSIRSMLIKFIYFGITFFSIIFCCIFKMVLFRSDKVNRQVLIESLAVVICIRTHIFVHAQRILLKRIGNQQ